MELKIASIAFLIGAALGLRFDILTLVPAIGLALVGIVAAGIGNGDPIGSVVVTMVLVASALQIGYLAGSAMRFVMAPSRVPADASPTFAYGGHQHSFSMFKNLDVQNQMEVVGSDGEQWAWSIRRKPPSASS
jgi:hypothetical protein